MLSSRTTLVSLLLTCKFQLSTIEYSSLALLSFSPIHSQKLCKSFNLLLSESHKSQLMFSHLFVYQHFKVELYASTFSKIYSIPNCVPKEKVFHIFHNKHHNQNVIFYRVSSLINCLSSFKNSLYHD